MSYQQSFTPAHPSNYTKGRGGKRITTIVIHHWDDPAKNPQLSGVITTFQNPGRGASAHFVVEAGRVVQMVDLANTAWHAGNWPINQCSIGIECNPRCSDADKATIGELIRNLQATYGPLKIIGHKDASSTACPGRYYPPAQVLAPYITGGGSPAAPAPSVGGDIEALAQAVIRGEYGNGEDRKARLGSQYSAVQARVNEILAGRASQPAPSAPASPAPAPDIEALADAVIRGDYGNGADRKARLGHLYDAVQARVNAKLSGSAPAPAPGPNLESLADVVIRGEYGNGAERRNRLGHLYDAVQAIVNRKLS
ncbi:N-acetylmuramoyl-L-alanine amidase [Actinomyces faecalis]|uniref:N-acetylmuramoyl-L-alanine amidase n=1 Tax=Actinomyces faecalis TaxID=2722820 RepID=UPI001551EDDF|nr:N-acetylmuramoyl-L-alanine amidase [Actinomyces faecalis]